MLIQPIVNVRRLILGSYLALFAGLTVTAGVYFFDTREEYERLKAVETRNRLRIAEAERELAREQKILERLRNDPAFVEQAKQASTHTAAHHPT